MDDFFGMKIRSVCGLFDDLLVVKVVTFWMTLDVTLINCDLYGEVIRWHV